MSTVASGGFFLIAIKVCLLPYILCSHPNRNKPNALHPGCVSLIKVMGMPASPALPKRQGHSWFLHPAPSPLLLGGTAAPFPPLMGNGGASRFYPDWSSRALGPRLGPSPPCSHPWRASLAQPSPDLMASSSRACHPRCPPGPSLGIRRPGLTPSGRPWN